MTNTLRSTVARQMYTGCQAEYILREKFGENFPAEKSYFVRGNATHQAIQNIIEGMEPADALTDAVDWADIQRTAAEVLDYQMFETKKCEWGDIPDLIIRDIQNWQKHFILGKVLALEHTIDYQCDQYHLVTTIDLLHDKGNGPSLIDWKTGAAKSDDWTQLYIYWFGLRKTGVVGEGDDYQASFFYTGYPRKPWVETYGYPGDDYMHQFLCEAERRRTGTFFAVKVSRNCKLCEFRSVCPAFDGELGNILGGDR